MRHAVVRVLPYTPEQLFELVGDVEAYPQFVPWIQTMRTWNRREERPGVSLLDAEVQVGFSFLKERFSTRVRRDAHAREITVSLLNGPFKRLLNRWRFDPHPVGTEVKFDIDFEFRSKLLEALLAANFHHAVDRLIACFDARAEALYGKGAAT
ncbi:MAG: type II toxin-antitoxin system RatA family toxin [Caulobacteraceae bacterium]|nr:type II toxin-antitoxin system RatA family toxin [Caulobacteraceae bacterium]